MGCASSIPLRDSNESRPMSTSPAPHRRRTSDIAPANDKGRTYLTTSAIPLDRPLCPYHKYQGTPVTNPYKLFVSQPSICWKCKEGDKDQKKRPADINTGPPDLPSDRHEDNRKRKPAKSPSKVRHHEQEESMKKAEERRQAEIRAQVEERIRSEERFRLEARAAQIRVATDTLSKSTNATAGLRQAGARGPYPSRSSMTSKFRNAVPPKMVNHFQMR